MFAQDELDELEMMIQTAESLQCDSCSVAHLAAVRSVTAAGSMRGTAPRLQVVDGSSEAADTCRGRKLFLMFTFLFYLIFVLFYYGSHSTFFIFSSILFVFVVVLV